MKKRNTKRKRKIVWTKKAIIPLLILVVFPILYIIKLTHPSFFSISSPKISTKKNKTVHYEKPKIDSAELRVFRKNLLGLLNQFKVEIKQCESDFNKIQGLVGKDHLKFYNDEKKVNNFLDQFDKATLSPKSTGKIYLMFDSPLMREMNKSWLRILFKELKPCKASEKGKIIRVLAKGFTDGNWSSPTKERLKRVVKNYFLKELQDEKPLNVLKANLMEIVLFIQVGLFEKKDGVYLANINLEANEKGLIVMRRVLTHIKNSTEVPVDIIQYERRESKKLRVMILDYVRNLKYKKEKP